MLDELLVRYFHFIGILMFASGLVVQVFLLKMEIGNEQARNVVVADRLCGIGVLVALLSGFSLWFMVGKPSSFYSANWVFYFKLLTIITIILLAIKPIVFFSRLSRENKNSHTIPRTVILLVRAQLVILTVVPLIAVFMARGYGHG